MSKDGKIALTIITLFYVLSAMIGISRIKIVYDIAGNGIGLSLFFLLLVMFFIYILLVFSIFPKLAEFIAATLGIASAVNFIFLFIFSQFTF